MEPTYDKSSTKTAIRVWNKTNGYLDVSEEGHLLSGQTAAWVEPTNEVILLVEQGLLEVLEGELSLSGGENAKKKKSISTLTKPSPTSDTEPQVAVDGNNEKIVEIITSNNDVSVETV